MDVETEIRDLKSRVTALEKSSDGLRTAFVKLVPLVEETRLRVSNIESDVTEMKQDIRDLKSDVGTLKNDISSLRKDLPGIVAEAMRDVLRETR